MFIKALVILASISAAFAFPQITEPTATTSLTAGTPSFVRWSDNGTAPSSANFSFARISIYTGNSTSQTFLQELSARTNVSQVLELRFTPTASIGPNSVDYFIRMESLSLMIGPYPAMVFSAKFGLTGMTGVFTPAILDQIRGSSGSPSSPSSTGTRLASPSPTLATSISKSSTPTPSGVRAASGAESIVFHSSWIGFLLSAFFGVIIL